MMPTGDDRPVHPPHARATPPLDGVRVVEAAGYVTGPFAGLMLAQLGAQVTKVEPPDGDTLRRFGLTHEGMGAVFVNLNHGKTSRSLDLKSDRGRAEALGLIGEADVFLQNWRPGVADSLGLGYEELSRRNPRLVYAAISGYGDSGPKRDRPVFDSLIQAATGLAVYEAGDGRPAPVRSMIADKTTASFVVQAVLAALVMRERTGRGRRVSLSMLDVMGYFNFPDMCQDRTFLGGDGVNLAKGRSAVVRTADGHLVVSPVTGRQITAAVTAIGHPEWAEHLKAAISPTELTDLFYDYLESVTPTRTTREWEATFRQADVPATAVLDVDGHFEDAQTAYNRLYFTDEGPAGPVRRVRYPVLWDGDPLPDVPMAPSSGPGE